VDVVLGCLAFALVIAFFFLFGWYGYLVNRLWGTSEYGGRRYVRACLKAFSTSLLLFMAIYLAHATDISDEKIKAGMFFATPFLLLGWFMHMWRHRRAGRKLHRQ
jgi:hypothetical protein